MFSPTLSSRTRAIPSHSLPSELKLTARLGTPLAIGELGWMSTYIVDAIMVGRMPHSALAIAASSLGNSIFSAFVFCAIGLLYGLDALVSQAFGRGEREDGLYSLLQSLFVVAVCAPVVMLATSLAPLVLTRLHVDPIMVGETTRYLHALGWSALPLLLYMGVRHYLQAIDRPGWVMVSLLTANLVNLGGDWALIYGHIGFPAMGIAGSGWATVLTRVYMLALLLVSLGLSLRAAPVTMRARAMRPDWHRVRALLRIGWPVGLQSLGELSLATFSSVLLSKLGATLLAAHQVVLDLNAFVAMVPIGIAAAAAVRTGQGVGARGPLQVRRAGYAGVLIIVACMVVAALSFFLAPRAWAHIYTTDAKVVAAAIPIFAICACNQVFDGSQVVLAGALRGMGETRIPFLASFCCNWLIGIPVEVLLVTRLHMGLVGVWLAGSAALVPLFAIIVTTWVRRTHRFTAAVRQPYKTPAGEGSLLQVQ
jgi:MATE family multidrug resistance protein